MLRRWLLAIALIGPIGLVSTSHVDAAVGGGRITLEAPFRIIDTRLPPPSARVTFRTLGSGVLNVTIVDAAGPGTATIRPCGATPTPSDPRVTVGPNTTSTLRVVRDSAVCLYSDVGVHLLVDRLGQVAPSDTNLSRYNALAQPRTLLSTIVTATQLSTKTVDLGRPAELPADAVAAVVSVAAVGYDSFGYAVVHACGATVPDRADFAWPTTLPSVVALPQLGPSDRLCLSVGESAVDIDVDLLGWLGPTGPDSLAVPPMYYLTDGFVPEPGLVAVNPQRALDTRNGIGCLVVGGSCVAPTTPIAANQRVQLDLNDFTFASTTAVSLNVTVTGTAAEGFVTVWPCDQPEPDTSNLNFGAGDTRANLVVAKLAPDGTVCIKSTAGTDLLADVTGSFEFGGGVLSRSVTPERLLDTRNAIGIPSRSKVPANGQITVQVAGRGGLPNDADAVTLNVTAVEPEAAGFLTAWPCDEPLPEASNLNFSPGRTVPNQVTVKLSSSGTVCLFTSASAHLLADVGAWFGPSGFAGLVELAPGRLLDTRNGIGAPRQRLAANGTIVLQVTGREAVRNDATAVVMNVTVTGTAAAGFATVWPCDAARPTVSNLNFRANDTVPNLVTVKLAASGTVCIFSDAATDVLADVAGYFTEQPTPALVVNLA